MTETKKYDRKHERKHKVKYNLHHSFHSQHFRFGQYCICDLGFRVFCLSFTFFSLRRARRRNLEVFVDATLQSDGVVVVKRGGCGGGAYFHAGIIYAARRREAAQKNKTLNVTVTRQ